MTPSGIELATLNSYTYRYKNRVLFISSFYVAYIRQQIGLKLKEKVLKCSNWSIALCGAGTELGGLRKYSRNTWKI